MNVIFMVSDGFGPASETFGRTYYQYVNKYPSNHITPLDKILVGQSRTRSNSSLITDSAAGATAYSCGHKTYNYGIAVTPDKIHVPLFWKEHTIKECLQELLLLQELLMQLLLHFIVMHLIDTRRRLYCIMAFTK
jgi:alkaline phosphatase